MGHYPACEKATSRRCVCQKCCGSLHGWVDAIDLTKRGNSSRRIAFRRKAERDWKAAFAGRTRTKPSFRKKSAGIDLCQAEIIDRLALRDSAVPGADLPADSAADELWKPDLELVRDMDTSECGAGFVDKVEMLANRVVSGVLQDIEQECGGTIPISVRVALADHFWCDLLAQLAHAIDGGLKHLESVPDRIADWVMKSREQSRWRHLEDRVVRTAARSLWKRVRLVTFSGLLNRAVVLPVVRVLAILICKAPERHEAVVRYCVDPLEKDLFAKIRDKLVAVLSEWLPRMGGAAVGPSVRATGGGP